MDTSPYANFLLAFAGALCFAAIATAFRLPTRGARVGVIAAGTVALIGAVLLASTMLPGVNSLVNLLKNDRFETAVGGLTGLLAGLALTAPHPSRLARGGATLLSVAVLTACAMFLAKDSIKAAIRDLSGRGSNEAGPSVIERDDVRLLVETYATLEGMPTCLGRDESGQLHVGLLHDDIYWSGVIARLEEPGEGGGPVEATPVVDNLVRPHGMAFRDGELYVARTGEVVDAVRGQLAVRPTGALTRLTDTDGDGKFDLARDLLADLPGAFGVHGVSGLAVRGDHAFVAVGAQTDHSPTASDREGTIVRVGLDGSDPEVFARGIRNVYDLIVGPDDELFCTDNDADDLNRGDAVLHVREGAHLGFPYAQVRGVGSIEGVDAPLYIAEERGVLEGLAYAPPGSLPEGFDDCFYVANLWSQRVLRLRYRSRDDGRYEITDVSTFVEIAFPLDLEIAPEERAIYILGGYDERKVHRVTFAP